MRQLILFATLLALGGAPRPSVGQPAASPHDTMVAWFQDLDEAYKSPDGTLVQEMIGYYTDELRGKFMPDIDRQFESEERPRYERALAAAAALHRDWGNFLTGNNFSKASFEGAEEYIEGDQATVVVRSDTNVARSFRLVNVPGAGWVISELPPPNQYATAIRILLVIAVCGILLAVIGRKFIFS